jgi:carboxyl-terminal processing protease
VSFLSGYLVGRGDPIGARVLPLGAPAGQGGAAARPAPPAQDSAPADLGHELSTFWETWNFVEQSYYRRPVERRLLAQGAIKGLLQALNDPHGSYLDPQTTRVEKAHLDGIIEGIGSTVELKERRFTILAPIEDGPAWRAGLRTGDVILKVDGRDIGQSGLAEAVALLRGASGTKVRLTVQRADDPEGQPVEVELTRARLELEAVTWRMAAEGIGYIRIRVFGSQTVPQLTRALREMRSRRVRGIVLDLRDNPGGYLTTATDVASQFIKDGKVVFYEEQLGQRRPTLTKPGGLGTDLTVAVLVNRGTASASEMVAGALRDQDRGVLIGESSFGKGSVQQLHDLSDGSAVRLTTGTWLTPNGKSVEGPGLVPAVAARPTADDERARRDVALEKALEWFKVAPPDAAGAPGAGGATESPAEDAAPAPAPATAAGGD